MANPAETPAGCRIALLSPASDTPEDEAFAALQAAAASLGHQLFAAHSAEDLVKVAPDFVIATSPQQAKTTSFPTFGAVHTPRLELWRDQRLVDNLLSYDGWLAISDNVARLLRSLSAGLHRDAPVGVYHPSAPVSALTTDIEGLAASDALGMCCWRPAWDPHAEPLLKALGGDVQLYAPSALGWPGHARVEPHAASMAPVYPAHGVGLVTISRDAALDDLVPAQLFEIVSVGAACLCPDIPWIRQAFGDSVFYYDPWAEPAEAAAGIRVLLAAIKTDPAAAAARALEARRCFEESFAAEVMLGHAVRYFSDWRQAREDQAGLFEHVTVDVIVRVGGRPLETVRRAVESIDAQTAGRIRLILVNYAPFDTAAIVGAAWSRIHEVHVVAALGGGRSQTLCAGLKAVTSDFFAILDDDDYWLDSHLQTLLESLRGAASERAFTFSGIIEWVEGGAGDLAPRVLGPGSGAAKATYEDILGVFSIHCFLAARRLLDSVSLDGWSMNTGEDSALIGSLLPYAQVRSSFRPTAVVSVGRPDASQFAVRADRDEDILEAFLRIGPNLGRVERRHSAARNDFWREIDHALRRALARKSFAILQGMAHPALENGMPTTSLADRPDLETRAVVPTPGRITGGSGIHREADGQWFIEASLPGPWIFGLTIKISDLIFDSPQWLVVELSGLTGPVNVGVIGSGGSFIASGAVPAGPRSGQVWLRLDNPQFALQLVVQAMDIALATPVRIESVVCARSVDDALRTVAVSAAPEVDRDSDAILDRYLSSSAAPVFSPDGPVQPLAERGPVIARPILAQPVAVLPEPLAWMYGLSLRLEPAALVGVDWIVVETGAVGEAFGLSLIDRSGAMAVCRVKVPEGKDSLEVWLPVRDRKDLSAIVLHNWEWPLTSEVIVKRVTAVGPRTEAVLALDPDGETAPLKDREDLWVHAVPLGEAALDVLPQAQPWAYGLVLPLDVGGRQGPGAVVVDLDQPGEALGLGVLDAAGGGFLARMRTPDQAPRLQVWLPVADLAQLSALVIHNWDVPVSSAVTVRAVSIVADAKVLQAAL